MLALCCCLSAASGEWLEKNIMLPDSLGAFAPSECQVWDSADNRLFLGGDSGVLVIDPVKRERLAIVRTSGKVAALCVDPMDRKVYCAVSELSGGLIAVVDDRNDQIIDSISTGGTPGALCYDSRDDRVYCARSADSGLTVIDGVTDSVLTTVPTGPGPRMLCYNPNDDKVCTADGYGITVIGCDSDVVLNRISMSGPLSLCHNTRDDKEYCGTVDGVVVIDGATNAVRATITYGYVNTAVCYDSRDDRIYCASCNSTNMAVIDGVADSVIATIPAGGPYLQQGLCYNWRDDKAYCTDESSDPPIVYVIDCAADTVAGEISADCTYICYNSADDVVYCTSYGGNVAIVDGSTDAVTGAVASQDQPVAFCYVPQHNKVYCASYNSNAVVVIDAVTNALLTRITTGLGSCDLCYNPIGDQVYCANHKSGTLSVIDAAKDSVLTTLANAGWNAVCYSPQHNRVYCDGDSVVVVIDATADTVLHRIDIGWHPFGLEYNTKNDQVYALVTYDPPLGVVVIDAAADTVRARLDLGGASSQCYSPVNNEMYFACLDNVNGYVAAVDGASDSLLTTIPLGNITYWPTLSYDSVDNKIYCTIGSPESVAVIDCTNNGIAAKLAIGPQAFCYSPEKNRVYYTESDTVLVIDAATSSIVARVNVGNSPGNMVWDPAQSRLYVANQGSYISVLRDSGEGIQDGRRLAAGTKPSPTIVRGILYLPRATSRKPQACSMRRGGR